MLLPFGPISPVDIDALANFSATTCEYRIIVQTQAPRPMIPAAPQRPDIALSLAQLDDLSPAWDLLAAMENLERNWDGYDADPIGFACISQARILLVALPPNTPPPDVTPNPNGTLTLDWETDDQALSLEIGATRFSSFWESKNGIETDEGRLEEDIPGSVVAALAELFPQTTSILPVHEWSLPDASGQYRWPTVYGFG